MITNGGRTLRARNPRTGALDHQFLSAGPQELEFAAKSLREHQRCWSQQELGTRIEGLKALAAALKKHRTGLHEALSADTGRSRIAAIEIDSVIAAATAWCDIARSLKADGWTSGRTMPTLRHRPRFVPYPVVTVVSPWNFPLLLSMIDALPALLAGASVWVKPSEITPRFIAPLRQAIDDAPLISGVLHIVYGDAVTAAAMIDRGDCVCFTGSVANGRQVAVQAARKLIPAFLELGGKDPLIVLRGADLETATDAALRASVLATGQACNSIERIYVAREAHDEFVDLLCRKSATVRLNFPNINTGEIGPIISDGQARILETQIADARLKGAKILTGGRIEHHGGGLWLAPTVMTDLNHSMLVMVDETFGPIMPVMAFDHPEEAIALANDTQFGLSAAVFGASAAECEAVAERLEAGAISINDAALTAVFHEAGKQSFRRSGLGPSRMGIEGLTRFARRQAIIVNDGPPRTLAAFSEDGPS